jgi:hypothetical protein
VITIQRRRLEHGLRSGPIRLLLGIGLAGPTAGIAVGASPASPSSPPAPPAVREVRYDLDLRVDYSQEKLIGLARLSVRNVSKQPAAEVPLLLYRLLTVDGVRDAAGRPVPFTQDVLAYEDEPRRQVNVVRIRPAKPIPPGDQVALAISYSGYLAGYVETGERYVRDRIDPEFTILRSDCLAYPIVGLPSRRAQRAALLPKFDFVARITAPDSFVVAHGGELVGRSDSGGQTTWEYRNLRPAWRMDFTIARYGVLESPRGRVYYFPADSAGAARVRTALDRSMELFTSWFGRPLEAAQLNVIEIPDGFGSQKDVTSILQTASSFRDARRLYEVYHEVSHIWNVPAREPYSPRIEEGLATYLEDVAAESLEGGPRVARTNETILEWLRDLLNRKPEYRTLAMKDYGRHEATDLSYSVGFLMFQVLHELVGDAAFREIVGGYYRLYHASGGTTSEFVTHARSVAKVDLDRFFEDWLETARWSEYVMAGESVAALTARYR